MIEHQKRYHESLIQWVWQQLEFNCTGLQTACGKPVEIISQGELNHGAGPDFLHAKIVINNMVWHGSVEIHNDANEWVAHKHQNDPAFNNVILHVVTENPHQKVYTADGSSPYTLHLSPYLNKGLNRLLYLKESKKLPCGGNITYIHQQAFEKQVSDAHLEYFNYKVEEFAEEFDPSKLPSEAWRWCLVKQLYSAMGVPSNRKSMKELAEKVYSEFKKGMALAEFTEISERLAFHSFDSASFNWKKSGMRPASMPAKRVRQAAALLFFIFTTPFKTFLKEGVSAWEMIRSQIPDRLQVGSARNDVIRATVFLPAIYYFGNIFHFEKIKKEAFSEWKESNFTVPQEVKKPFLSAGYELNSETKKMGLAHQYKRYCLEKQCHRCEVFKSVIRS